MCYEENKMSRWIFAIIMFLMLLGCNQPLTVSKAELMDITQHWKEPKVAIWYCTGSNNEYHYFRFIDLDGTKDYRVRREKLQIDQPYPLSKKQKDWLVMPWGPQGLTDKKT